MRLNLWPQPGSLYARVALILLAGLLVAQGVSLWLQWGERSNVVTQARAAGFADRMARAVRVLETVGDAQLDTALPALQDDDLAVVRVAPDQVAPTPPRGAIGGLLASRLGGQREIRHVDLSNGPPADPSQRRFDVRLQGGQWVRITLRHATETAPPALSNDLIAQLLATLLIVTAVVMIAVRQVTRPLQQLAQAADALASDLDSPPLPEQGSSETRRATQAFNRMQSRIKRLVNERARALASVSHDLRTPLTRLRLRAELVSDDNLRDQMAADLEAMATMLDATLDYLRGLQDQEPVRPIDINALLGSMADDARVLGRSISLSGQANTPFTGRLSALRRALQNLIDNAFKYGQRVSIEVQDSASQLCLSVQDDGPGIAPAELAKVTEPYYRVDSARSPHGGVGLGLSIARDIALLHDGELRLNNRPEGGLAATLCLPRS